MRSCVTLAAPDDKSEVKLMRYMWLEASNACHGFGASAVDAMEFASAQACPFERHTFHEIDAVLSHLPLTMAVTFAKAASAAGGTDEACQR